MTNIAAIIVSAIIAVETPCGRMVGDNGRAIGRAQVHPIMAREVNRLCGTRHCTSAAYRRAHSEAICRDFVLWGLRRGWSLWEIAQAWNGGLAAPRNGRSKGYARKVLREYERLVMR